MLKDLCVPTYFQDFDQSTLCISYLTNNGDKDLSQLI